MRRTIAAAALAACALAGAAQAGVRGNFYRFEDTDNCLYFDRTGTLSTNGNPIGSYSEVDLLFFSFWRGTTSDGIPIQGGSFLFGIFATYEYLGEGHMLRLSDCATAPRGLVADDSAGPKQDVRKVRRIPPPRSLRP